MYSEPTVSILLGMNVDDEYEQKASNNQCERRVQKWVECADTACNFTQHVLLS
jgi:hypothetical protein